MTKVLYLECKMGAAGDMLMAALSELVDQETFVSEMNKLGLDKVNLKCEKTKKQGITGTYMHVLIDGEEEGDHHHHDHHDHDHEHTHHHHHDAHDHEHHHDHHHTSYKDIEDIIGSLNVSDNVKKNSLEVYKLIAEAESKVHDTTVEEIHFHEVGNLDAVMDIVGVSLLIEKLNVDMIIASPVAVGNGFVKCAHGTLPVPAPATALILEGIPSYAGDIEGELCTPTGAALLKHYVTSFENMPVMKTEKIGYGLGKKDFSKANMIRAFIGETNEDKEVVELVCSIDDQSAEEIGFAINELFTSGALEVYTTPIQMKKSRPGTLVTCMCKAEDKENMLKVMFKNLSTIGIREYTCQRYSLDREFTTVQSSLGEVRIKKSSGYGTKKEKMEYDDLEKIAKEKDLSIKEVKKIIEEEIK